MKRADEFISAHYDRIDGWLYKAAIELTETLLDAQRCAGIEGIGIEIGIFKAKYLSFLAFASDYPWYGFDVFIFDQQEEAQSNLRRVLGEDGIARVRLRRKNSQLLSESELFETLGCKIAFASIDGDHSCEGVMHDLRIVERNLTPGAIVAVDDVFSPMSPAVSEGFFRYLSSGESLLRPVAFADNKLFLTTHGYDELYRIKVMTTASSDPGICGQRWRDGTQINRVRPFLSGQLIYL